MPSLLYVIGWRACCYHFLEAFVIIRAGEHLLVLGVEDTRWVFGALPFLLLAMIRWWIYLNNKVTSSLWNDFIIFLSEAALLENGFRLPWLHSSQRVVLHGHIFLLLLHCEFFAVEFSFVLDYLPLLVMPATILIAFHAKTEIFVLPCRWCVVIIVMRMFDFDISIQN